ncbi:MAG: formate/nitrite transporter family protein [Planctomycetia bacterium]
MSGTPGEAPGEGPLGPQLALAAEAAGVRKAAAPARQLLALGVLAGAFIALGAWFSLTVATGSGALPWGVGRLLAGLAFALGLVLVVGTGAELFTGNVLLVMAWTRKRLRALQVLRCWGWVLLGNLLGALATAALLLCARAHEAGGGALGTTLLQAAAAKVRLDAGQAFVLGLLCNGLVCLAVWISYGARSTTDRVLAVLLPVTAFVALGLEHSVANLFLLPWALGVQALDPAFAGTLLEPGTLGVGAVLLGNVLPVLLGNVVGGTLLVALPYALAFDAPPAPPAPGR